MYSEVQHRNSLDMNYFVKNGGGRGGAEHQTKPDHQSVDQGQSVPNGENYMIEDIYIYIYIYLVYIYIYMRSQFSSNNTI